MRGILSALIISVIIISLLELLLPEGNIKKIGLSVMGVIFLTIIVSPVVEFWHMW